VSLLGNLINRTPVPLARPASGGLFALGGPTGQQAELASMSAVGTAFAIIDLLATSVAAVEWKLWRKAASGKDEDRIEVTSHAAIDLWQQPTRFHTRQELVEANQQHQELTGEGWLVIGRDERSTLPLELWGVSPERMMPVPDPEEYLAGYVYQAPSGERVPLGLDDVLFMRRPNPQDAYRGLSPVASVLTNIGSARAAAEWNRNFFLNSAEPGGIVEVPVTLGDDDFNILTKRWAEAHAGVNRAHRVAVLEGGAKWVGNAQTMRDMQFTELDQVSREKIREAFRVGKTMLGLTEDVNRATAQTAEAVFAKWIIVPRLERWKQALNSDLLPLYGGTTRGLEFDYESPIPHDEESQAAERTSKVTSAVALISTGRFLPAAVLAAMDLPEIGEEIEDAPAAEGDKPTGEPTTADARKRDAVEAVQKVYLGVDSVITSDEARELINAVSGAGLVIPGPDFKATPESPPVPVPSGDAGPPRNGPGGVSRETALWNVKHPPLPDEDHPDLGPLADAWDAALGRLLDAWGPILTAWQRSLLDQVKRAIGDGDIAALATLAVNSTDAAALITEAMAGAAGDGADAVVKEAKAQDVTVDPVTPEHHNLAKIAGALAAILAAEAALGAGAEGLRVQGPGVSAAEVAGKVSEYFDTLTDARPRQALGGALTGAQNAGRSLTLMHAPEGAVYASEILDGNTCKPCRKVNGRWLGNTSDMDQINLTYPQGAYGGYVDCEGRSRCRGTVIGVWRPKQTGA
jgi:HK97 family phage portal protein